MPGLQVCPHFGIFFLHRFIEATRYFLLVCCSSCYERMLWPRQSVEGFILACGSRGDIHNGMATGAVSWLSISHLHMGSREGEQKVKRRLQMPQLMDFFQQGSSSRRFHKQRHQLETKCSIPKPMWTISYSNHCRELAKHEHWASQQTGLLQGSCCASLAVTSLAGQKEDCTNKIASGSAFRFLSCVPTFTALSDVL